MATTTKKAAATTQSTAPTLTPLDLSAYATTDSPEVAALKAKVSETAMKYARRHNWCSEVQRALRECGITDVNDTVTVKASTMLGVDTEVNVPLASVRDKTLSQQVQAVATALGTVYLGSKAVAIPPSFVTGIEAVARPTAGAPGQPGQPGEAFGREGRWMYSSNLGRTLHAYPRAGDTDRAYHYPACGNGPTATADSLTLTPSATVPVRKCARCQTNISGPL